MKILMVHKTYKGGVAVHVKEVSNELRKKGFIVHEVTRNEDLEMKNFITSYQKMKKLFKKWSKEYDIVHTHDWSITYPAIKAGIKNLVATFHGFPSSIIAKFFEEYSIKKLGYRAVVVSPAMKRRYPTSTYIPNGVDLKKFKRVQKVKKNTLGISQKYNRKKIKKIGEKYGFEISIAENVPHEKMPTFYSRLEIFVSIPPPSTGFNLSWLEAMACEVPYIIGTNAGIGEILPIYKVNSFKELEIILGKIKNSEVKPLKNLRKWITKKKLRWEDSVFKLAKLYSSLREL